MLIWRQREIVCSVRGSVSRDSPVVADMPAVNDDPKPRLVSARAEERVAETRESLKKVVVSIQVLTRFRMT